MNLFTMKSAPAALALLAAASLAACASRNPDPLLEQARAQVSTVERDPTIAGQAPLELQQARRSLTAAESSFENGDDDTEVRHRAYVALQQAAIAREVATARQTQERIKSAEADRTKVLLATRTQQAETAEQRAQRLQQELRDLQARQTERGTIVTLGNVLFQLDSAELLPGAASSLDRLATFLQSHPDATVQVEGYTDSTGSASYNLNLSQRRANSVREALLARGIPPTRIVAQGFGETTPVASNDSAAGRQLNRRVEVVVSGPGLQAPTAAGAPR